MNDVKQELTKYTSENCGVSEEVVEAIVDFQIEDILKQLPHLYEFELSGFGKFCISKNKLNKRLKDRNTEEISNYLQHAMEAFNKGTASSR